ITPNQQDLQLTLYSGTVQDVPTDHIEQLQRLYFNTQKIRVAGVGNAFQKTLNDNYKGEREMSVCEMQRNAVTSHYQFVQALKEYRTDVSLAKTRGVKLSKEALTTKTKEPYTVGVGRVYCQLLAQLKIKQLLAEEPRSARIVVQDTTQKPRVDTVAPAVTKPKTDSISGVTSVQTTPIAGATSGAAAGRATVSGVLTLPPPGSKSNLSTLQRLARPAKPVVARVAAVKGDTVPPGPAIPNDVIPGQVESARLRLIDSLRNLNLYEVEIQKKFALAAACFVFVLLGAPIALRFPRGGVGLTIGVSLVVFGLYYVGLIAGESLARRGMVPPVVSMWLANLVFGTIALILLARMGMESGSSRGGDIREVFDNIRQKVRRKSSRPIVPRRVARALEP
ncbi:MAG: LptF/LptG family permease, partial [Gemmatimonadales bacterium]